MNRSWFDLNAFLGALQVNFEIGEHGLGCSCCHRLKPGPNVHQRTWGQGGGVVWRLYLA